MRIALAQYDFPVGDITGNVRRIQTLIEQARDAHGADLIVFPELCVSGYSPEDLLFRPQFLAECDTAVRAIAHSTQGIVAVVGWPEAAGSVVYNAASVIRDGRIETTYRKRDLPNHAVFDERRYFETDPDGGVCVFQVGPVPIGLLICQDLWGLEPMAETTAAGARLVLVPNASPFERHKHAERDALLAERARDNGTAIAYVNVVGGQDSTVFDGASLLADARGAVAPAATAFEEHLLITDFDPELQTFTPIAWPRSADESEDGLMYQALVIGTRDYCKKNGFDKVILGLSGGIDSSLVLAIAADALGGSNVTAVRMPSRYTAELSNDLASAQCEALGVSMLTLPIETPFQAYLDTLAPVFKGAAIDTTEENLQARIRGAMLMALSNKLGGLVLTTGNKSEYAVGYATIYGDMVGGYAPLKDVYKTEVYRLAHWRNTVGPLAIPQGVIQRAPSAELRPDQKDQDSLPPYDVLDALLFRHIDTAACFCGELLDRVISGLELRNDVCSRSLQAARSHALDGIAGRRHVARALEAILARAYTQGLETVLRSMVAAGKASKCQRWFLPTAEIVIASDVIRSVRVCWTATCPPPARRTVDIPAPISPATKTKTGSTPSATRPRKRLARRSGKMRQKK